MTEPTQTDSQLALRCRDDAFRAKRQRPVVYICCAVEDLPEPYVASDRGLTCAVCAREVWWDPRAMATAEKVAKDEGRLGVDPMCQRCANDWAMGLLSESK